MVAAEHYITRWPLFCGRSGGRVRPANLRSDDTRRGCIDSGLSGKRQSEHFFPLVTARSSAMLGTWDAERAVFVNDCAFRAHTAKRCASAAQYARSAAVSLFASKARDA